jgi:hypothetical protein
MFDPPGFLDRVELHDESRPKRDRTRGVSDTTPGAINLPE